MLPGSMFFIKSCNQIFLTLFLLSENKNRVTDTCYINIDYMHVIICKYYKVYEDYVEFDTEKAEDTKSAERQNTSFPKEQVKNPELYKPENNA